MASGSSGNEAGAQALDDVPDLTIDDDLGLIGEADIADDRVPSGATLPGLHGPDRGWVQPDRIVSADNLELNEPHDSPPKDRTASIRPSLKKAMPPKKGGNTSMTPQPGEPLRSWFSLDRFEI